ARRDEALPGEEDVIDIDWPAVHRRNVLPLDPGPELERYLEPVGHVLERLGDVALRVRAERLQVANLWRDQPAGGVEEEVVARIVLLDIEAGHVAVDDELQDAAPFGLPGRVNRRRQQPRRILWFPARLTAAAAAAAGREHRRSGGCAGAQGQCTPAGE